MQDAFVRTHDGNIHYLRTGYGKPLIFLHSVAQSSTTWLDVTETFGQKYSVFAMDMVGHGDTDKPAKDYSIADYAQSVSNFMTALDIGRASLVGNSIGGTIALETACRYPERVDKLVLVGCPAWTTGTEKAERRALSESQLDGGGSPRLYTLDDIRPLYRRVDNSLLERLNANRAKVGGQYIKAMYALCDYDLTTALGKIASPTLVLFGEKDLLIDKSNVLVEGIRDSRFEVVENAHHLPQIDDPQAFSQIVMNFLEAS